MSAMPSWSDRSGVKQWIAANAEQGLGIQVGQQTEEP